MYIVKNALKSITRNKLRNILIGIIVLIISVSACVSLSIRQAAEVAKEDTLSGLSVTGQISFDREKSMKDMMSQSRDSSDSDSDIKTGKQRFDFDVLQGSSLSLDEYMTYTKAQSDGDSYYYSAALSLNATGKLLPYGTEEESGDSSSSESKSGSDSNPDNDGFKNGPPDMQMPQNNDSSGDFRPMKPNQVNQGDFQLTGYSSYDAMLSMFGEDGTYTVTDGEMFDENSDALECIISNELAIYNDLSVGDTIKLSNPKYEDETYKLKIVGIYTNSASSSEEDTRFRMNDPANNIYLSYNALSKIVSKSEKAANTTTDSDGNSTSAVLKSKLAFTYTFKSVENYESFAKKVYDLGLSEDYKVSSSDLQSYENSLLPLETLSTTAIWFFFIVLGVGAIILITLNIFNLRERKYEIGVLTAIGMKKAKVSFQFVSEIFIVTFIALIIGTSVGAAVSVPVTNALLQNQVQSTQESGEKINDKFGFKPDGFPGEMSKGNRFQSSKAVDYVDSVSGATNLMVIIELIGVGLALTIFSSLAALISILKYEPLKILSGRT